MGNFIYSMDAGEKRDDILKEYMHLFSESMRINAEEAEKQRQHNK